MWWYRELSDSVALGKQLMELIRMNGTDMEAPKNARSLASFSPYAAEMIRLVVLFENNEEPVARLIKKGKDMLLFPPRIPIDLQLRHRRKDVNAKSLLGEVQRCLERNHLKSLFSIAA